MGVLLPPPHPRYSQQLFLLSVFSVSSQTFETGAICNKVESMFIISRQRFYVSYRMCWGGPNDRYLIKVI